MSYQNGYIIINLVFYFNSEMYFIWKKLTKNCLLYIITCATLNLYLHLFLKFIEQSDI